MKDKSLKGLGKGVQWFEQKIYDAKPKRVHEQQQGVKQTTQEIAAGKHQQVFPGMLEVVIM